MNLELLGMLCFKNYFISKQMCAKKALDLSFNTIKAINSQLEFPQMFCFEQSFNQILYSYLCDQRILKKFCRLLIIAYGYY